MKKIILVLAILLLVGGIGFFVLNPGDGEVKTSSSSKTTTAKKQESNDKDYSLHYDNVELTPGAVFDATKIDKEAKKSVIPSCAFEGEDNVYTYEFMEVTTHLENDKEIIYSVYFIDDSISTDEGIKISDDFASVKEKYGEKATNEGTHYSYKSDKVKLTFDINNDVVIGIEYTLE